MEKVNLRNEKFKGTRDITKFSCVKDLTYGYSWPQRNNYKCSFCKKEFKSAQALGGHMNVHRRDRAKMRLSPSWDNNILQQNPNPNSLSTHHPPSSPMSMFLPSMAYKSSFTEFSSPSSASIDDKNLPIVAHSMRDPMNPRRGDLVKNLNEGAFLQLGELTGFAKRSGFRVSKKKEMVTLDFDIGLLQDAKEELDLELRLGYS